VADVEHAIHLRQVPPEASRQLGLPDPLGGVKARRKLDLKPDIHVRRVFWRTGLVARNEVSDKALIDAARCLAPDYPAVLDAPAWDIGRQWCRPRRPNCSDCPIGEVCRRVTDR
jgi:endonuclease III